MNVKPLFSKIMPYGTLFQSIPTPPQQPNQLEQQRAQPTSSDSASKLTEAIDDFLGDLETKFRGISDEILTKLDDMAERCDRLEAELLMKETVIAEGSTTSKRQSEDVS